MSLEKFNKFGLLSRKPYPKGMGGELCCNLHCNWHSPN